MLEVVDSAEVAKMCGMSYGKFVQMLADPTNPHPVKLAARWQNGKGAKAHWKWSKQSVEMALNGKAVTK